MRYYKKLVSENCGLSCLQHPPVKFHDIFPHCVKRYDPKQSLEQILKLLARTVLNFPNLNDISVANKFAKTKLLVRSLHKRLFGNLEYFEEMPRSPRVQPMSSSPLEFD